MGWRSLKEEKKDDKKPFYRYILSANSILVCSSAGMHTPTWPFTHDGECEVCKVRITYDEQLEMIPHKICLKCSPLMTETKEKEIYE